MGGSDRRQVNCRPMMNTKSAKGVNNGFALLAPQTIKIRTDIHDHAGSNSLDRWGIDLIPPLKAVVTSTLLTFATSRDVDTSPFIITHTLSSYLLRPSDKLPVTC